MDKLLIATQNRGKLAEIYELLKDLPIIMVTPAQLGISLKVEEDGETYAENASRKASALAEAAQMLALADDSGLEVDALGGMPGLRSARFSPKPGASDADRRAFLLEQLKGKPQPWTARFRCVIAIASPAGEVYLSEGVCPGEVIDQERGSSGFGYDPIFLLPELGRTMAELGMGEKNRLSHRARALLQAKPILSRLLEIL